jgi:hypothetical protein
MLDLFWVSAAGAAIVFLTNVAVQCFIGKLQRESKAMLDDTRRRRRLHRLTK